MLIPHITNDPSKVQLSRLAHVYFEHPNLKQFAKVATDFWFIKAQQDGDIIYYRGYGKDPYVYVASRSKDSKPHFRGPAFVAASEEEFKKAQKLPGAIVKTLDRAPGGGRMITIPRPGDTSLHIVHGQTEREVEDATPPSAILESQGPINTPFNKPRRGEFQRYHQGPALVHKLGHFGYVCKDFDSELDSYISNFNIIPSDILYDPERHHVDILAFMHLDLGREYSDHHVFFMSRTPPEVKKTYVHHTSYEVADFDTQLIGHAWLAKKECKSVWGVGRHILGSQIFDYWQDPTGFKVEHYADGDVVNMDTPTRRDVAGPISVWGPELPKDFGDDGTEIIPGSIVTAEA